MKPAANLGLLLFPLMLLQSCSGDDPIPSKDVLGQLNLKRGKIILCGPPDKAFGVVDFGIEGSDSVRNDFNTAVELLHSFEYDEAEKAFAKVIDESPGCAMAYWGVAMCCFHPLWEPPNTGELTKGSKAVSIAYSVKQRSARETAFIDAIAAYYRDWGKNNPHARNMHFEEAMEKVHEQYPGDREAAVFYALALDAAALPTDKTYANQRQAGRILDSMYVSAPDHPGIVHYIIHTYDYPGLAKLALPAARRYADVAPASAHALHMPSHIFTRLGLWDESIQTNLRSMEAARCHSASSGLKGPSDEELHDLDYLVYAYLQKGDNKNADAQIEYLRSVEERYPESGKGAYTVAASPCRIPLENGDWAQAAHIPIHPASFPWSRFPWQEAIIHFTRLIGAAHTGDAVAAQGELKALDTLQNRLTRSGDAYRANQVAIQIMAGEGWVAGMHAQKEEALRLMAAAAEKEDSTSKPPVTPGEVLPAREQYADMLLDMHKNDEALTQYKAVLQKCPGRFNSLFGAGLAAERSGNIAEAINQFKRLLAIADPASGRPELQIAKAFLEKHS